MTRRWPPELIIDEARGEFVVVDTKAERYLKQNGSQAGSGRVQRPLLAGAGMIPWLEAKEAL